MNREWLCVKNRAKPPTEVRLRSIPKDNNTNTKDTKTQAMATIVVTVVKAIQDIIGKARAIYNQLMQVKKNKKGCERLADRVKTVVDQLEGLANQGVKEEVVQKAVDELKIVLEEAETLLKKYEETNTVMQTFNADTWREDFEEVNKHLCIAAHHLSLSLQVEQRKNLEDMFNDSRIRKENGEDMKIDQQESDKLMETKAEVKDVVDNTNEGKVGTHEGAGPKSSSALPVTARGKVKKSRIKFINRIGKVLLEDLLNHLQEDAPDQPPVISKRESNHVLEEYNATENRVTCLVDMVLQKGERACEIFLSLLKKCDKNLYEELGL